MALLGVAFGIFILLHLLLVLNTKLRFKITVGKEDDVSKRHKLIMSRIIYNETKQNG